MIDLNAYWKAVFCQDRAKLPTFFAEDAKIYWHCTDEWFDVGGFVRVNCDYPGAWDGSLVKVFEGEPTVCVAEVREKGGTYSAHVTSIMTIKEDKIVRLDEYWADDGKAPKWRVKMGLSHPIKGE